MNKRGIVIGIVLLFIVLLVILVIWSARTSAPQGASNANTTTNTMNQSTNTASPQNNQLEKLSDTPTVRIATTLGDFTIKLYQTDAPELSRNFLELARSGYYNGLTFHRIVPGFVVQGGDPSGNGSGGHSYKGEGTGLADEPGALALKHLKGAVAWAKSSLPNSIGSQFYVALDDLTQLDGSYSVFGHVVEGFETIDKIAAVQTNASSVPMTPVTMNTVAVTE